VKDLNSKCLSLSPLLTGGLVALAVKVSRKKNDAVETIPNANKRSSENVNTRNR
jgi:hypothetical protein